MSDLDHILGNEHLKKYLRAAVGNQKVSHAYILEGEKGSGKKTIAAAFSKILQCDTQGTKSCGHCTSCIQIEHGDHPDVIWVTHEKPNVITVSEIREQVINTADVIPYKGPYKIYLIDQGEKMNLAAQNALLKTIEEPPSYVVIMILTSNKGVFLPTILSRCVKLSTRPVPKNVIKDFLIRQYKISAETADFCAGFSMGNPGRAIDICYSEDLRDLKEWLTGILREIKEMSLYEIYQSLRSYKKLKEYHGEIFDMMVMWFHDLLILKSQESGKQIIFTQELASLQKQERFLTFDEINNIINRISEAADQIHANVNVDIVMESLLYDIKAQYIE